jgi:hypothetical protein
MKTLGEIKYELINKGISVSEEARRALAWEEAFPNPAENELTLVLTENLTVKPQPKSPATDRLNLEHAENKFMLASSSGKLEVMVAPQLHFIKGSLNQRSPVSGNVTLDGFCLKIFLRAVGQKTRLNLTAEEIIEVIQMAFEEEAADLIQFNMDYCKDPDRGFKRLIPVIATVKKKFNAFIALKGFPPDDLRILDQLYAAGVDILNLPLNDCADNSPIKPSIPREQISRALEYASGIFPKGAVWTELVLGGQSLDMKHSIYELMAQNSLPLIKLQPLAMPSAESYIKLREVAQFLQDASSQFKIPLKWMYPNCQYLTPLDASFYIEGAPPQLKTKPLYQSSFGKKAEEGFAAFRRKLRIKNISDSFESAGL